MASVCATMAWDYLTRSRITSPFETEEMKQYPIFFVPRKRFIYCNQYNEGFDDEDSRYDGQIGDHVQYRYEIESKAGSGAFGDCWLCYDHKTGNRVALKIIRNERRFLLQGRIEVQMLEALRKSASNFHCAEMIQHFTFRSHLCITFNVLAHDLYAELKLREFVGFDLSTAQSITEKVLKSLVLLKQEQIVHADLKPENILFNTSDQFSDVTVIDFGSSCFTHGRVHTYIQSRYYRSPEIVLGLGYGCEIDMWSMACVLAELVCGRPIFPAKTEKDLLLCQQQLLGVVPAHLLDQANRANEFFYRDDDDHNNNDANNNNANENHNDDGSSVVPNPYSPRSVLDRKGRERIPGSASLAELMLTTENIDPVLEDFIMRCLCFDPASRMTPTEALAHPFITSQHDTINATSLSTTSTTTTTTTTTCSSSSSTAVTLLSMSNSSSPTSSSASVSTPDEGNCIQSGYSFSPPLSRLSASLSASLPSLLTKASATLLRSTSSPVVCTPNKSRNTSSTISTDSGVDSLP